MEKDFQSQAMGFELGREEPLSSQSGKGCDGILQQWAQWTSGLDETRKAQIENHCESPTGK